MLRNYLLTTLRNIARRRGFSALNILGLSIGLAASLLILQYVKDELSYDDFHTNADRIYRVQYDAYRDKELMFQCATVFPKVAPALKADYPEIENTCRLYLRYGGGIVRYNDISIKEENVFTVDQSFLEMFSYPLVSGDRNTALKEANTALVEEETARKYFGDEDPIGKRIKFGNREDYEITGVIRSPENSHLKFTFLFSYPTLRANWGDDVEEAWGWYDFYNYVLLKPGSDPADLEAKFPEFIRKYGREGDTERMKFSLQHLPDIHLYSDLIQEARVNGDGRSVYFLMVIALFILGIAWVNYINLATARAVERAKEVGVRKAIGAERRQLMLQFIGEAFLLNLLAVTVALLLLTISIPTFNQLSGKSLSNSILLEPTLWYSLAGLFVVGSLFSGVYPAFVLSSYKPARVLKGAMSRSREGLILRKALVIVQFVFSVGLIASTLIVYQQLSFMQNRDLGVDVQGTLVINAPGVLPNRQAYFSQFTSFRNEMLRHPGVTKMSGSTDIPGRLIYWTSGSRRVGEGTDALTNVIMYRVGVDYDFFDTYGNKLVAGRFYSREFTGDSSSVVLNRRAIETLGFKNPEEAIGDRVRIGGDTLTVVGVIENYHQEGLRTDFRQTAFHLVPENHEFYSLKVSGDLPQTIAFAREKYQSTFPGNPFDYFFLDTFFNRQYEKDEQFGQVFGFFALLAIFVAGLGLFGLASFTAAQRTKEIGIRKVLGSSVPNIFFLLSFDFLKLVIAANIIAVPLVWLLMERWLDTFAFRISIGVGMFIIAAVATLLIALLTVSYQSIRAAVANPVHSLRYE